MNGRIDYSEFRKLWAIVRGEVEVLLIKMSYIPYKIYKDELEIRTEFKRVDLDENGYITKGKKEHNLLHFLGLKKS